jgi:hypothetical protein
MDSVDSVHLSAACFHLLLLDVEEGAVVEERVVGVRAAHLEEVLHSNWDCNV